VPVLLLNLKHITKSKIWSEGYTYVPVKADENFIFSKLKEGYVVSVFTGIVKHLGSPASIALHVNIKNASNLLQ